MRELARALGHERASVVGHDIGAHVAYALAATHPDFVDRLALTEAWLPGFGFEEGMDVANGGLWQFGFHMQPEFPELLTAGRERQYLEKMAWKAGPEAHWVPDDAIEVYLRTYAAPGGMTGGFNHYRTLLEDGRTFRRLAQERRVRKPVLVVRGSESGIGDRLLTGARQLATEVREVVVPEAGHWLPEEKPRELTSILIEFLKAP